MDRSDARGTVAVAGSRQSGVLQLARQRPVSTAHGTRPVAGRSRIVLVAVSFMRSGTEQVILDLARYFVAAGHKVFIFIPRLASLDGMADEARRLGATAVRVGPLHSVGHDVVQNGRELYRLFRRIRPDVVHFHVPWEPVCFESVVARLARVPVRIRTEHNPALEPRGRRDRLKMRVVDETFDAVVYLSEGNRLSHTTCLGRRLNRSTIIGNGVDPHSVSSDVSPAHRAEIRRRLDVPTEVELAVLVGNLEPRKGPLDFIRAASFAANLHPSMHFVLVGDGVLRAETQDLAAQLGIGNRTHLLGGRPDVRSILSAFDVYVQASYYEGMSVAMLEALAAGLPMITTRVDGVEDVLPGGIGALRVDIGDWRSLGAEMARLAGDSALRQQLTRVSQRRVLDHFTVDAMCTRYAALYRGLGAAV